MVYKRTGNTELEPVLLAETELDSQESQHFVLHVFLFKDTILNIYFRHVIINRMVLE